MDDKWDQMIKRIKDSCDESDEVLDARYFTGLENFYLSQQDHLERYFIFSRGCHQILEYGSCKNNEAFPFEKPAIHDALDAILTEFEKWILEVFWEQIGDIGREIYPEKIKIPDQELADELLRIIKKNKKLGEEDDTRN